MKEQVSLPGFISLDEKHYLGRGGARARATYEDARGVIVFSACSSRRLPTDWWELSRWCIVGGKNAGSQQWAAALPWFRERVPDCTTIVSYSDPSVGHDGALYRACGWLWAPVWHVLREPPSGGGMRGGHINRAKHRWIYPLARDERRASVLALHDESLARRMPWASYVEPRWFGKRFTGGGGDWKRWRAEAEAVMPHRTVAVTPKRRSNRATIPARCRAGRQ